MVPTPLSSRVLGSNPAVLTSGRGVRPQHYSPALSLPQGTRQKLHIVTMGLRNNIQQLHTPFLEHLLCANHLVGAGETTVNSVVYTSVVESLTFQQSSVRGHTGVQGGENYSRKTQLYQGLEASPCTSEDQ